MAKDMADTLNFPRIRSRGAIWSMIILCITSAASIALAESSYNSSTIHLESEKSSVSAPVRISAGNGYYVTHPIDYNTAAASRTQVTASGLPAASLRHSVDSAKEISGSTEYTVSGRSYRESGSEEISTTTIGMKISETVTEGRVSIGAFQADGSAGGREGMGRAWKNPAFEMEEEYIGTYSISKNMTISSSNIMHNGVQSWLVSGMDYLDSYPPQRKFISASDVFSCLQCRPVP